MEQLNKKPTLEESLALLLNQNERTIAMLDGIATKADENFIKIECRLNKIEDRLSKNEARLHSLSAETSTNFTKVVEQLSGIKAEIVKIGAATPL
ncbi:hypothetical protein [Pedobacter sp. FW305-3-2-15-E-R2A2]|uniref:hypothetical protein n=1 Tax=Pedobacter sp. FW305-3-2-15-E-R2A2 TaxID=3140251 RepID=UPI003140B4DC